MFARIAISLLEMRSLLLLLLIFLLVLVLAMAGLIRSMMMVLLPFIFLLSWIVLPMRGFAKRRMNDNAPLPLLLF